MFYKSVKLFLMIGAFCVPAFCELEKSWKENWERLEENFSRKTISKNDSLQLCRYRAWNQDYSGSKELLQPYLNSHPEDFNAVFLQCQIAGWSGNFEQALICLQPLLKHESGNFDALLYQAQLFFWSGDYAKSLQIVTRIEKLNPGHSVTKILRIQILEATKLRPAYHLASGIRYNSQASPLINPGGEAGIHLYKGRYFLGGVVAIRSDWGKRDGYIGVTLGKLTGNTFTYRLRGEAGPGAEFLPHYAFSGLLEWKWNRFFSVLMGSRYAKYSSQSIVIIHPGLQWTTSRFGSYMLQGFGGYDSGRQPSGAVSLSYNQAFEDWKTSIDFGWEKQGGIYGPLMNQSFQSIKTSVLFSREMEKFSMGLRMNREHRMLQYVRYAVYRTVLEFGFGQ